MKNFICSLGYALMFIIFPLSLASCSDDDDESTQKPTVTTLVGTWTCYETIWEEDGEKEVEKLTEDDDYYITLDSDGYAYVHPYDLFEYEMRGTVTWSVDGYKLAFHTRYGMEEFAVTKLTDKELVLFTQDEDVKETYKFRRVVEHE